MADSSMAEMGDLAHEWESDLTLRNFGRQHGLLTAWPSVEATGVASMSACSMNHRALEIMSLWWVQQSELPQSVLIDEVRAQVGDFEKLANATKTKTHNVSWTSTYLDHLRHSLPIPIPTGTFLERANGSTC